MLILPDTLAGDPIEFRYVESRSDLRDVARFVRTSPRLGIDTESTGINCYRRGWQLRSVQIGDSSTAYVIPARYRKFIRWMAQRDIQWIGHNGPHDWRSIDEHLGIKTGSYCIYETYILAHHHDPRNRKEGGTGNSLKDLAEAYVDYQAGKWEKALKAAFKEIRIPIPDAVYKSGKQKGMPKMRKALLSEGWGLIPANDLRYIAYSGADPILTYRVWDHFQSVARGNRDLYIHDWRIQNACDILQRRGFPADLGYTYKLGEAYLRRAVEHEAVARQYGCANVNSGMQLANTLLSLGVPLKSKTPTGAFKTDNKILRQVLTAAQRNGREDVELFIRAVLGAKQLHKRRESYTEAFLREADTNGRVHASIRSLGARTARMSVAEPPLQQLPTRDNEADE